MASAAAMLSGLVVSSASASNLGSLQAQARAIESRISALGLQASSLSERYDEATIAYQQVEKRVASARAQVIAATGKAGAAEKALRVDAVSAYVSSGTGSLSGSGRASTISGADSSLLRAEYEQTLATNQRDSQDRYELASKLATTAEIGLRVQEAAAAANVKSIAADKRQVEAATVSLTAAEAQDQGRIGTLIAQQQAAAQRAAHAAALQRLAQARAAQQAQAQKAAEAAAAPVTPATAAPATAPAVVTGTPSTTPSTIPVTTAPAPPVSTTPPSSSAAAAAVGYAESRVGDPYVWGAAGPTSFDCSGLVMWAYAQAGVSLPHFSGAQYADTIHISMADLEPGDIVFFSNPDIHEAMYVGNGDVVQAPYPGASVQIVPLYSEFTLATRVG